MSLIPKTRRKYKIPTVFLRSNEYFNIFFKNYGIERMVSISTIDPNPVPDKLLHKKLDEQRRI